jgi:pantothenate kinase type III
VTVAPSPSWRLVADCGNTDLKLALVNPLTQEIGPHHRFTGPMLKASSTLIKALEACIAQWPMTPGIGVVWTRSHAGASRWFEWWVEHSPLGRFGHVCPISPGYRSIRVDTSAYEVGQLGADRVANVVAATTLFPGQPCLIADFGTATNFDAVDAQGRYLGGLLIPGWETVAMALSGPVPDFADRLQAVCDNPLPMGQPIGLGTQTGLALGLVTGYQSMIQGCLSHLSCTPSSGNSQQRAFKMLATGGLTAHPQWDPWLGKLFDHTLTHLTLLGLGLLAAEATPSSPNQDTLDRQRY